MGLLTGKTALVTGAARGIGKAVAMKFASEGANIAFTDLVLNDDMAAGLEATRKEIEALGVTCRAYAGNAADFEETEKTVKQIHADFGSIDILVNNAGITKDGLMLRMTEAQWDAVLNVNLKSAFNFIHACSPIMLRQRSGSIINMASVVGVHGNAGQCNYAASKAGMIALAKSIAQELGPKGVRANAVAPGFIETAMTAQLPEEIRKDWMKKIPLRRGGQTEDIANVCLFLVSKRSGEIVQGDKTGDEPLSETVKQYIKEKYQKPGNVFLGVVHRLDRPVSGLVVFAKTSKALSRLNNMFRDGEVHKTYWAIVKNMPRETEATLTHWIVRNEKQNKSYAYDHEVKNSKKAILKYKVIGHTDHYTLLEVNLMTGRHHQIRCQLAKMGCPIKGDLKYGSPRSNADGSISLLSHKVEFVHPVSKETIVVEAPLPDDNLWRAIAP